MRLDSATYEEIKREVVSLFKQYGITSFDMNDNCLALRMGITLVPYSELSDGKREYAFRCSEDGFFMEHNGREYIYYNDQKSQARIKWTVRHELGHCHLGHTDDMREEKREAEADFFAKYSLAPPPVLHQYQIEDWYDVEALCGLSFEASVNALNYYKQWLLYAGKEYQDYELGLLWLFGFKEKSIKPKTIEKSTLTG